MALIRLILGKLILFFNWLFKPKGMQRDAQDQAIIDQQTSALQLYQYEACPFCVKVRRAMTRLSLDIQVRDVKRSATAKEELLAGGGRLKVPCLRIVNEQGAIEWMYESSDIVNYLENRFSGVTQSSRA
ncbi:glutathione S-transferase N-terminal domain-containing protein [Parahaliea sp. F7430]|uniref:Glutathione S-transferase N-terminal domain-containing protein n=1 Tax=Sediminihaliea albiluteola TaxID=2758564 RepID=A0A7W2TXZ4_9GAMM|nr:glutathione S-transferase N-terminal domain-containing protein [Sediminihaliea albiluteola]MBA6414016.1 glutathione S-transferase N-terminal domain-containing protein [Sediminihaliea albiluteola]